MKNVLPYLTLTAAYTVVAAKIETKNSLGVSDLAIINNSSSTLIIQKGNYSDNYPCWKDFPVWTIEGQGSLVLGPNNSNAYIQYPDSTFYPDLNYVNLTNVYYVNYAVCLDSNSKPSQEVIAEPGCESAVQTYYCKDKNETGTFIVSFEEAFGSADLAWQAQWGFEGKWTILPIIYPSVATGFAQPFYINDDDITQNGKNVSNSNTSANSSTSGNFNTSVNATDVNGCSSNHTSKTAAVAIASTLCTIGGIAIGAALTKYGVFGKQNSMPMPTPEHTDKSKIELQSINNTSKV